MAKTTHNPKLLTGLYLEEETVEAFKRHPHIEGKSVIKVSHDPIPLKGLYLEEEMMAVIPSHILHPTQCPSMAVTPHQYLSVHQGTSP